MYITNTLKIVPGSEKIVETNGEFGDKEEAIKIALEDNGQQNTLIAFVETNGNPVYIGWTQINEETGRSYDVETDQSDWDFENSWFTEENLNQWIKSIEY